MTGQLRLSLDASPWTVARDADPDCRRIFHRHYSRYVYADGRDPAKFVGPGQYICLVTPDLSALFVWRKFIDASGQRGVNCAVFRNEGGGISSLLILAAEDFARAKWPSETRFYTYVNARKIRSSNPGYCFICAGWRRCGITKRRKLIILEKLIERSA
jgi:hypothetical protein